MIDWIALVCAAGFILWLLWKLREANFLVWMVTHAVLHLIESGELTEEQYYGALRVAEPRCEELRKIGVLRKPEDLQ